MTITPRSLSDSYFIVKQVWDTKLDYYHLFLILISDEKPFKIHYKKLQNLIWQKSITKTHNIYLS